MMHPTSDRTPNPRLRYDSTLVLVAITMVTAALWSAPPRGPDSGYCSPYHVTLRLPGWEPPDTSSELALAGVPETDATDDEPVTSWFCEVESNGVLTRMGSNAGGGPWMDLALEEP